MEIIYKKVDELIPYVNNPRNNKNAIDKVASSIKNFGFKVPIVIDASGEIIAGHTRLEGAKKLKMKEIPCIVADDLTDAQVREIKSSSRIDIYVCKGCNEIKTDYLSNIYSKNKIKQFCSKMCRSNSLKTNKKCNYCDKEFEILKSVLKTNASGNFCSRDCYNLYQKTIVGENHKDYKRIEKECNFCNKKIKIIPAKENEYKRHFCSRLCKNEYHKGRFAGEKNGNWRGGHKNRKGDFESVKRKYFRKTQICACCGTREKIHIHHIVPFRYTEDNDVTNLIPLCIKCHRKIEIITWELIDSVNWNDFDILKLLLNNILRNMQFCTQSTIKMKAELTKG